MAGSCPKSEGSDDISPKKILFLGDDNIGKTTFIWTYRNYLLEHCGINTDIGTYLVFKQFRFYKRRGRLSIPIQFLDLPAGTTAESRRDQYPYEVVMIVLCYAVDDPASFANVLDVWLPEIRQHFGDFPRCHLLGLRSDLRENEERRLELSRENREPVTLLDALRFHQDNPFSREYNEVSAIGDPQQAIYVMNALIVHLLHYTRYYHVD